MTTRYWLRVVMGGVLVILIVAAGFGIYEIGMTHGLAEGARSSGHEVIQAPAGYYAPWGRPHAFGFFGLIFPFLFFLLIFGLIRGILWRPYLGWHDHRCNWGSDRFESLQAMHRKLHEAEAALPESGNEPTKG